ncbi:hypothetical protein LPJ78_001417 [Coemansia sp. RSA 989]|nr:hypothetical protein LPJ78_001417 [Coemansia sp. RSA 989]
MDKISIKADAKTFMTFTNVVLPAARSTICKVFGDEPVDGSQFVSVFNQLMRNSLGCESVIVNITDCVSSCVGTLRCPGLTNLELNVMVDFNTMNAIIANHPRLIKLWLTASSKGWSEKEDESRQSIAPLNTSIREVRIDDYTARNPSSLQTTVLKYLMLRLPALHRVYGLAVDSSRLQQFVSKHLPEYPQLANIRFESESG